MTEPQQRLDTWLAARPHLTDVHIAITDLNGCLRGKRVPRKFLTATTRMPLSLSLQDIWGRDTAGTAPLDDGDPDGIAEPTGRQIETPWSGGRTALILCALAAGDGGPSPYDPRHLLARQAARAAALGLTPVIGQELEFHLTDGASPPGLPVAPDTRRTLTKDGIHSLDDLERFAPFFTALYAAAEAAGIPAATAISESATGQFELTLAHGRDPLRAADDAVLLRRIIRGTARAQGHGATFMAKPFGAAAGNGFHVHLSLLDGNGRNIFADPDTGDRMLGHAVAGCLTAMPATQLIFAPHVNSYRRMQPGNHAPVTAAWARENRYAALRIPGGAAQARRIEHRVAAGDANPYLVLAAILGAALNGLEARKDPPPPRRGNLYAQQDSAPKLPATWSAAQAAFAESPIPAGLFGADLTQALLKIKAQEAARFATDVSPFEHQTYLDTP
ncbi:MAG: glutamine synthetase family protein [Pseudomonadota bacterium]